MNTSSGDWCLVPNVSWTKPAPAANLAVAWATGAPVWLNRTIPLVLFSNKTADLLTV